jgi:hypothetical protein
MRIVVALVLSGPLAVHASEWIKFGEGYNSTFKTQVFYDGQSVQIDNSVVRVWIKYQFIADSPAKYGPVFFAVDGTHQLDRQIAHRMFDCQKSLSSTDAFTQYASNGISAGKPSEIVGWHPVEPETNEEFEMKAACSLKHQDSGGGLTDAEIEKLVRPP